MFKYFFYLFMIHTNNTICLKVEAGVGKIEETS